MNSKLSRFAILLAACAMSGSAGAAQPEPQSPVGRTDPDIVYERFMDELFDARWKMSPNAVVGLSIRFENSRPEEQEIGLAIDVGGARIWLRRARVSVWAWLADCQSLRTDCSPERFRREQKLEVIERQVSPDRALLWHDQLWASFEMSNQRVLRETHDGAQGGGIPLALDAYDYRLWYVRPLLPVLKVEYYGKVSRPDTSGGMMAVCFEALLAQFNATLKDAPSSRE